MEAEVAVLRRKIARVEALCRDLAETLNEPDVTEQREDDIATILRLFRAALADEDGDS